MQMEESLSGECLVITPLEGRLDAVVAAAFRDAVVTRIDQGPSCIVLDMQHVGFLDSSGLGAMVFVLKHLTRRGGRLHICSIAPAVMAVLRLTRMDRVMKTFDSRDAAIAA